MIVKPIANCPHCGGVVTVPDKVSGEVTLQELCPHCQGAVTLTITPTVFMTIARRE